MNRLQQQIQFIVEIDKLKGVIRRSPLINEDRRENSGEHSWHLAMLALVLMEHSNVPVDILKVLKMLLIHDIVEIDAGDTFLYDEQANVGKVERERLAAQRIFGLLPEDQAQEMIALWEEFEAKETAEAKFGATMDRLMPLLHSYHAQGKNWRQYGITVNQIFAHNTGMAEGSEIVWEMAQEIIADAIAKGYLSDE